MAGRYGYSRLTLLNGLSWAKLRVNRPALAWLLTVGNLNDGGLAWLIGGGFKKDNIIICTTLVLYSCRLLENGVGAVGHHACTDSVSWESSFFEGGAVGGAIS